MEEYLTLVLNENRIVVNREKLASKSCYFASLFSHNFRDSHNKEHNINYDISLHTLQNFVEWVHHEDLVYINYHFIKVSMTKFMQVNFIELLNLLKLSVLFAVDELTNDIIDIIVLRWLLPEKIIYIWLLAQELGIKILEDICLSVCLDQFENLPRSLLLELSLENINRLIGNVNVKSNILDLLITIDKWIKHHKRSAIVHFHTIPIPKFIEGTVIYERGEEGTIAAYLYTWDGNALSKCVQLHSVQYPGKWLIGMQVVARGFSIYTIGGEVRLGSGRFNEIISRYCLISRKWYYHSKFEYPRRHMITVFIGDKLVIVGGVGKYRLPFATVHILDMRTGKWTRGRDAPVCFNEVPVHVVANNCLIFLKPFIYVYTIHSDSWVTISSELPNETIATLTTGRTFLITGNAADGMILRRIDIVKEDFVCEQEGCLKQSVDSVVKYRSNMPIIKAASWSVKKYLVRFVVVAGITVMMLTDAEDYKYVHSHTVIKKDCPDVVIPKLNCFKIVDPCSLYSIA